MKKLLLVVSLCLLLAPALTFASIDNNLYYGLQKNSDVKQLQEFLIDKGFLTGSSTGNFFSLTLKAVKAYQTSAGINSTGYVGTLTRTAINNDLATQLSASNAESTTETGTTPPAPTPPATTNDVITTLQAQIALLTQQLQAMQAQQTTTQQIQQNTQQIVQNTTPPACSPNWQCTAWNSCSNSTQTRTCTDSNHCNTNNGEPTLTQYCSTSTTNPTPTLSISCLANPSSVQVNQSATFVSSVVISGGTGNYIYSWTGDCIGNNANCSNSFSQKGTKTANLTVNYGSQTQTTTCQVSVVDTTSPIISNINSVPNANSVAITWTTDKSTTSKTDYGTTASYGQTQTDSNLTTQHSITINNLASYQTYNYKITSTDGNSNQSSSPNLTFQTLSVFNATISSDKSRIINDGMDTANITITTKKTDGSIWTNKQVVITTPFGSQTMTSDGNGIINYQFNSIQAGSQTISVSAEGKNFSATISVLNIKPTLNLSVSMGRNWACAPYHSTAVYFSIDHFANADNINNLALTSIKIPTENYNNYMTNFQLYKNSVLVPSQINWQGNTLVAVPNDPISIQSPDTDTINLTAVYYKTLDLSHPGGGDSSFTFTSHIQADSLTFTGTVNNQPATISFQANGQSLPYTTQEISNAFQNNTYCRADCFYGKPYPLCCGDSYYSSY